MRKHRGSQTRENANNRRRVVIERMLEKVTPVVSLTSIEQKIVTLLQQRVKGNAQAGKYINRKNRLKKSVGNHVKDTHNEEYDFDIVVYRMTREKKKRSDRYSKKKKGGKTIKVRNKGKASYGKSEVKRFGGNKNIADIRAEYPSRGTKIKYIVKRVRR